MISCGETVSLHSVALWPKLKTYLKLLSLKLNPTQDLIHSSGGGGSSD